MVAKRALEQLCELVSGLHGLRNAEWITECGRIMECKDYGMRIAMPSLGLAEMLRRCVCLVAVGGKAIDLHWAVPKESIIIARLRNAQPWIAVQ